MIYIDSAFTDVTARSAGRPEAACMCQFSKQGNSRATRIVALTTSRCCKGIAYGTLQSAVLCDMGPLGKSSAM
ncbi:hypothetical protein ALO76_200031 [Pseudomonas syringae pv. coriandricola]|nr:hypothetical protein ALO76_200031 [Pseudomonas syringae pv. coriandricola]